MTIRIERNGAVTTVVIDRPQARNAIDRATARALAEAFRGFDADPATSVAVPPFRLTFTVARAFESLAVPPKLTEVLRFTRASVRPDVVSSRTGSSVS